MLLSLSAMVFIFLITACGNDDLPESGTLNERIDRLIQNDRYQEALDILNSQNREEPDVLMLLEKTHLNYGLNSMSTFDANEMRTRMNNALIQFVEVLKINPENEVARNQINQILGVYDTMPNRGPEPDAIEALREIGIEY